MNNDKQTVINSGQPSEFFLKAIRRILRPLVKTLIANGVTFPMLAEMLKHTFVDTVDKDFRLDPRKKPTASRISLITGVHRKDIKKFREQTEADDQAHGANSLGAQIIAKWLGDSDYNDKYGDPAVLARFKTKNNIPSFENLVRSISTDIRPRAVLDDLVKRKILCLGPYDTVILKQTAFVPREDMAELMVHYGRNIHDHIAAAGHNIAGGDKPFMDRSVYHYGLSRDAVRLLEKKIKKEGMDVLLDLNREAQQLIKSEKTPSDDNNRITVGIYFYAEKDSESKP